MNNNGGRKMDLDYSMLATLHAVAKTGSFDGASRHLNITQSAVSQRIKQLEFRVGGPVLVRGKPCIATTLGAALISHLDKVKVLEHQLKSNFHGNVGDTATSKVTLNVAVNSDSLSTWFYGLIERAEHELGIYLNVVVDNQKKSSKYLVDGTVIGAVTAEQDPVQGFRQIAIGSFEYVAVCAPSFYQEHFSGGLNKGSITSAPTLFFSEDDKRPYEWAAPVIGDDCKLEGHKIPSTLTYLRACQSNMGWGILPLYHVADSLANGSLVELKGVPRHYAPMCWQHSIQGSELTTKLAQLVKKEASKELMFPMSTPARAHPARPRLVV